MVQRKREGICSGGMAGLDLGHWALQRGLPPGQAPEELMELLMRVSLKPTVPRVVGLDPRLGFLLEVLWF